MLRLYVYVSLAGVVPGVEVLASEGGLHTKSSCLCHVYHWGSNIATPTRMPLPSSETVITQVAMGRTHKVAVTKNGRLFIWEVWFPLCISCAGLNHFTANSSVL